MKKLWIAGLLLTAIFTEVNAQSLTCKEQLLCRVTAPSGLRMRSLPSLKGRLVASVPKDSIVTACTKTLGSLTVEGLKGNWRKVMYKQDSGYMYDGFLQVQNILSSKPEAKDTTTPNTVTTQKELAPKAEQSKSLQEKPDPKVNNSPTEAETPSKRKESYALITEVYNYCGNVTHIDPGRVWYGIYPPEDPKSPLAIKLVEVEVMLSKHRTQENLEFDIKTDQEEGSMFLLGTTNATQWDSLKLDNPLPRLQNDQGKLFPGQEMRLNNNNQRLQASGGFNLSDTCADLTQYKLLSVAGSGQQNLTPLLLNDKPCTIPELYWFGDLTQDGIPELIFMTEKNNQYQFKLLVSNAKNPGRHYQLASNWKIINCP